jgi:hypothetical protein
MLEHEQNRIEERKEGIVSKLTANLAKGVCHWLAGHQILHQMTIVAFKESFLAFAENDRYPFKAPSLFFW